MSKQSLPAEGSSPGCHLDRDWLEQKYVVEGLSTYDIARLVGRDPKRVYEKLKDFGIPTRKRGANLKGSDNYMLQGNPNPFAGQKHTEATKAVLRQKASKPKPYLRGAHNGMHGRCGAANPRWIDGSSPERQRLYAQSFWKELVRVVYERDGYRCLRCGAPHGKSNRLHAHHLKPWAGNPTTRFNLSNIVTLCAGCHTWVHSKANTKRDFLR